MKRTVDINLNGIHFVIDEDAYTLLDKYLKDLERHFSKEEEKDVLTDIEARIAELFYESQAHGRNVIDIETTTRVLETIGRPEQMEEENGYDTHYNYDKNEHNHTTADDITNKSKEYWEKLRSSKLYRDTDDVMVSGICSGFALKLGVEVWIVRLIVAIAALLTHGWVLMAYIILWVLMPKAITVAQKLEMRGQQADLNSIQNFKTEPVQHTDAQKTLGAFIKIGLLLWGFLFVFAGCGALGAMTTSFGILNLMPKFLPWAYGNDGLSISVTGNLWWVLGTLSYAIMVLLPLLTVLIWGFKKVTENPYKPFHPATTATLWIIWIASVVIYLIARFNCIV